MNEKKICFIIHNDNKMSYSDNVEYIKALNVPRGMEAECLTVESDQSKFEAYNEGMYASDAKYKVYIGYNTYIINKNIIYDILNIFENDKQAAMIGIVGRKGVSTMESEAVMYGKIMQDSITSGIKVKEFHNVEKTTEIVNFMNDILIATSQDMVWGEAICAMTDGYLYMTDERKMVVARQVDPWCFKETILF